MNTYESIILKLKNDKRVLSCALGGSRSRLQHSEKSDYDIFCIITDEGFDFFLSECAYILESLDKIKIAVYTYYHENWGYMFKALSFSNECFDISIIPKSRVKEMAIRSTNKIIFDSEEIYEQLIKKADDEIYDSNTYQEQKKNDYLKLFAFEYVRFYKAVDANDYWYTIRCLERLKNYYMLYARTFLKIASKSFPEKKFAIEVDSDLQLMEKYIVDGNVSTTILTCRYLTQKLLSIATEKEMLLNILNHEFKKPQTLKIIFIDMEYKRAELNEPINVYVLLRSLSAETKVNIEFNVVYRQPELQDNNLFEFVSNVDVLLISSKVSSENELTSLLENYKNKPILLGGVIASHKYHDIVMAYDNVICAIGEGETNLDSLLRYFIYYRNPSSVKRALYANDIPNLYFKLEDKYIQTSRFKYDVSRMKDSVLVHPDTKRIIANNGLVRIESSRGCPWNGCSFCVIKWKYSNSKWSAFPTNIVIEEIKNLSKQGVETLYFTDEDFLGTKIHINELFSMILENKKTNDINLDMKFWGSTSVFTLKQLGDSLNQCLQLLKEAGVQGLFVGIESGSNSQLKRFNKGVTAEDNSHMLSTLESYGFIVDVGFIMFDPEVTIEEIAENMIFIKANKLDCCVSRLAKELRLISHTNLYEKYLTSGFPMKSKDFDIEYEYEFVNHSVQVLVKWIKEIDKIILAKLYSLQTNIRGDTQKWLDPNINQEIVFLRNIEYSFIEICLEEYKSVGELREYVAESFFINLMKRFESEVLQ